MILSFSTTTIILSLAVCMHTQTHLVKAREMIRLGTLLVITSEVWSSTSLIMSVGVTYSTLQYVILIEGGREGGRERGDCMGWKINIREV